MDMKDFDQGTRCFWGEEFFPYGMSRSGEFTREQVALLQAHGHAYEALAKGTRRPVSAAEIEFVAFCRGERDACSPHEKAWARYRQKTAERNGHFWLGSQANAALDSDELTGYVKYD